MTESNTPKPGNRKIFLLATILIAVICTLANAYFSWHMPKHQPSTANVPPPQQQQAPQQIPDSVVLEITPWQEAKVNNIEAQKNMLDQQKDILFDAILDMNHLTRADVQGKAIKTKTIKR